VTEYLTAIVDTVLILLTFTVLTAGMRENKRVIVWLLLSAAVAIVLRQLILGILGATIGASPAEHRYQPLGLELRCSHVVFIHIKKLVSSVVHAFTIGIQICLLLLLFFL